MLLFILSLLWSVCIQSFYVPVISPYTTYITLPENYEDLIPSIRIFQGIVEDGDYICITDELVRAPKEFIGMEMNSITEWNGKNVQIKYLQRFISDLDSNILDSILNYSRITGYPAEELEEEYRNTMTQYEKNAVEENLSLEEYIKLNTGYSLEEYEPFLKNLLLQRIYRKMVIYEIADAKKVKAPRYASYNYIYQKVIGLY